MSEKTAKAIECVEDIILSRLQSIKKDEVLDFDTISALKETVAVLHLLKNIGYVADKRAANHVPTR